MKRDLMDPSTPKEYASWIGDDSHGGLRKKIFLVIIFVFYLALGIVVVVIPIDYLSKAETHCGSIVESQWTFNGSNITISDKQRALLASN